MFTFSAIFSAPSVARDLKRFLCFCCVWLVGQVSAGGASFWSAADADVVTVSGSHSAFSSVALRVVTTREAATGFHLIKVRVRSGPFLGIVRAP